MRRYIYQQPTWPRFHLDQDKLAGELASVRNLQERLLGRMEGLGFALRAEATLQSLTEEILKSNEIEGEKLDRNQVRSSITRRLGVEIGALTPADRSVEGVLDMMLDATQKYGELLSAERLFGWHAAQFPTGYEYYNHLEVAQKGNLDITAWIDWFLECLARAFDGILKRDAAGGRSTSYSLEPVSRNLR